jgi:hypothetical protein
MSQPTSRGRKGSLKTDSRPKNSVSLKDSLQKKKDLMSKGMNADEYMNMLDPENNEMANLML